MAAYHKHDIFHRKSRSYISHLAVKKSIKCSCTIVKRFPFTSCPLDSIGSEKKSLQNEEIPLLLEQVLSLDDKG